MSVLTQITSVVDCAKALISVLDLSSSLSLSRTSKEWYFIFETSDHWKHIYYKRFHKYVDSKSDLKDWKKLCLWGRVLRKRFELDFSSSGAQLFQEVIETKDGVDSKVITNSPGGCGDLWTKGISFNQSQANLVVELDVKLKSGSEFIVAFSHAKRDWNSGASDAITYRCGSDTQNFGNAVRGGHFNNWIYHDFKCVPPNSWHHLVLKLEFSSNKKQLLSEFDGLDMPTTVNILKIPINGHFGLSTYSPAQYWVKNLSLRWILHESF